MEIPYKRRSSRSPSSDARVAQLVEHMTENYGVGGSNPPPGTTPLEIVLQTNQL